MHDNRDLTLVMLGVAYGMLGKMDDAHAAVERLLRLRPGLTIRGLLERQPPGIRSRVERIWPEGLRRAGLPEG